MMLRADEKWRVDEGDCRSWLPSLPAGSAHACITSPPYFGLRAYLPADHPDKGKEIGAEQSPAKYVAEMVGVFREVRRVLRDDGTLWLNLGDSYAASGMGGNPAESPHRKQATNAGSLIPGRKAPRGYKAKDLLGIPWQVAFALRDDGWYLRSDCIWCLSGGVTVYARTQKGDMPAMVKDLVRLNPATVKLWNGEKWTQVTGWAETPRPAAPLEIEFRNGERVGCTPGHVWPTRRGNVRADQMVAGDVVPVVRLPGPDAPDQPAYLPDEEIGWLAGFYMAEGFWTGKAVVFSIHADELREYERIRRVADGFQAKCKYRRKDSRGATVSVHGRTFYAAVSQYVSGSGCMNKRLTNACWRRSDAFLRAVLQGYLEGDGHHDTGNDRWRVGYAANDGWTADLRTLCARLGATVKVRRCVHKYQGGTRPGYHGEIRFSQSGHHCCKYPGEVMAVRQSRARKFWDIAVADEPHLYALASGILTHNSKRNAMPESVKDRPSKAHEYVFMLTKTGRSYFDMEAVKERLAPGSADRYGYAFGGKKSKALVEANKTGVGQRTRVVGPRDAPTGRHLRTVWDIPTAPNRAAHFAVMAPRLALRCLLASTSEEGVCPHCGAPWRRVVERDRKPTRPGVNTKCLPHSDGDQRTAETNGWNRPNVIGNRDPQRHVTETRTVGWEAGCKCEANTPTPAVVIDPFCGAGTTLYVATKYGRRGLGCELNPEYAAIARKRLDRLGANLFD